MGATVKREVPRGKNSPAHW